MVDDTRLPIVLVSGSKSSWLGWEGAYLASKGTPVLLLRLKPHLTNNCICNLNPQKFGKPILEFLKITGNENRSIVMVGLSAGGTATLLFNEKKAGINLKEKIAISPILLNLNGSGGLGCMFPRAYWAGNENFIEFYGKGFKGILNWLRHQSDLQNQRQTIESTIADLSHDEVSDLFLPVNSSGKVSIWLGGDDSLLPTTLFKQVYCESSAVLDNLKCHYYPDAGHNLLYSGMRPIGCSANELPLANNCIATRIASKEVDAAINAASKN